MPAPPLNSLETSNRLQITSEGYRLYVNAVIDMFAIEVDYQPKHLKGVEEYLIEMTRIL